MYTSLIFIIACTCAGGSFGYPATNDIFPGFVNNAYFDGTNKKSDIVKRRVYEENRDASLKQISLQSLIGDLEDSLFQSAISVSSVAGDKGAVVPEVTPTTAVNRPKDKRQTEEKSSTAVDSNYNLSHVTPTPLVEGKEIVLQTTKKVPEKEGVPAHILIDRISVQPHTGGVPLIPAFEVHHTKLITATIKEQSSTNPAVADTTQIRITKTNIKATNGDVTQSVSASTDNSKTEKEPTAGATETSGTSATSPPAAGGAATINNATPTTSEIPIVELKKAEEKLKEKVAEIEADPVILSARV